MRIAILNAYDKVVGFIDNSVDEALHFFEDELHTYLRGSAYTFDFSVNTNHENIKHLTVGNKVSFRFDNRDYYCNIVATDESETELRVSTFGLSFELINEETGAYSAPGAMSFTDYIIAFNFENVFRIGINEVSDKKITYSWDGTQTILARLYSLATVFNAELEFLPLLNDDYSLKEIVLNIYKEHSENQQGMGLDCKSTVLRYGKDITGINKTVDITELYTAIRPFGTDGLNLSGIEKQEFDSHGNVLYSSSLGSLEILAPQARDNFPSNLISDVNGRYIAKVWEYETSNVEVLYGQALAQLKKNCVPKLSYKIDGYINAPIGSVFTIEDKEFNSALYVEARITEQIISFTDQTQCSTVFDNFVERESQISSSLLAKMEKLVSNIKAYTVSVSASNGTVFKQSSEETELKASVFNAGVDVTDNAIIKWYKDGIYIKSGKTLTVQASSFSEKAVIKVEAADADSVKGFSEITLVFIEDGKPGEKGETGIIVSENEPTDPAVNQLWQTASGEPIKRWTGTEWQIHQLSVENLNVNKLSALSSDLGDIRAGTININDKFIVTAAGNMKAASGEVGGISISSTNLQANASEALVDGSAQDYLYKLNNKGLIHTFFKRTVNNTWQEKRVTSMGLGMLNLRRSVKENSNQTTILMIDGRGLIFGLSDSEIDETTENFSSVGNDIVQAQVQYSDDKLKIQALGTQIVYDNGDGETALNFRYSSEQWTGKYWVDGKKIYSYALSGTTPTNQSVILTIPNLGSILTATGFVDCMYDNSVPINATFIDANYNTNVWGWYNNIQMSANTYAKGRPFRLLLEYTKTI